MKYAHYDINTGKLLGFYDDTIHKKIPIPNIQITEEQWQEAISNNYNYVDADTKTLSYKDFRTPEQILQDKWNRIRAKRNQLLQETDIYMLVDKFETLTAEQQAELKAYRQALRDLPQTYSNPDDVVFPAKPSWLG